MPTTIHMLPRILQRKAEKITHIIHNLKKHSNTLPTSSKYPFFESPLKMYSNLLIQKANKYVELINESAKSVRIWG